MNFKFPLIAAFVAVLSLSACGGGGGGGSTAAPSPATLTKTDSSIGTGAEAVAGKTVKVHYTGWLYSDTAAGNKGNQFDTSIGKTPFEFKLGTNAVIPGFEQGVTGMKVGGKRVVMIPGALGYGAAGSPPSIPPNAGLVFEIELISAL
jgi:FKBP-type peptidyl-prolyl cis-trans isomerase FkpA